MAGNDNPNHFLMASTGRYLASNVINNEDASYLHSRSSARNLMNVTSDMHWSNSKDMANMPIFEDIEIVTNSDRDIYSKESPEQFGRRNVIPTSSALKALQGYGNKLYSPRSLIHDNCRIDEIHNKASFTNAASTNVMHTATYLDQNYNDFPTKSSVTIDNLNLKTVDEEDEYLYGDSSSLPEEPTINKDSLVITPNIPNNEWSDEEEYFGTSTRDQSKIKLNLSSSSKDTVQSKTNIELSQIKCGERSSNPLIKLPETNILHMSSQSSLNTSVSSTKSNANLLQSVPNVTNLSEIPISGNKTKYHLAAQKLKEQIYEKNNKNLSDIASSDRSLSKGAVRMADSFKNISNYEQSSKRTVILHKNSQFDRSQLDCNKMPSYEEDRKYDSKTLLQKDVDYISDCSKNTSRKRPLSPEDHFEGKDSTYRHFRDYSPTKSYSSSFNVSKFSSKRQSRSPSLEFQRHFRHHSPHRSSRNRYKSPSSRHRSPHDDYIRCSSNYNSQHYYDKQKIYSRSPSRKSREKSPRYHRQKDKSLSRERSKSPLCRTAREYSPKHLKPDLDKSIKMSYKLASKKDTNFEKKGKISRKSSSESIISESSRSVSPPNVYDKKLQEKNQTKILLDHSSNKESKYKFKSEGAVYKKSILNQSVKNSPENLMRVHEIQNKKHENEKLAILSANESNLNEEEKKIFNLLNPVDVSVINALMSVSQSDLEDSVPMVNLPNLTNLTDTSNTLPEEPHPQISCSQFYPFNTMPIPFTSPMNNFPSVIPNLTLPSSELNHPQSSTYIYPGAPVIPTYGSSDPIDKPHRIVKKRLPATLRSIPVSDHLNTATESMKEEKKIFRPEASDEKIKIGMTEKLSHKIQRVSNNNNIKIPLTNIKEQLNRNSPLNSKGSVENIKININKKVTNDNLILSNEDRLKTQNSYSPLIENFKKIRAERHIAQAKVNRIVKDIIEIENLIEQTWGKKTNSDERVLHIKCKNILNESNDKMNYYIKDAKRLDEKFSKLKEKVPKEIQDATKLEIENYMSEGHTSTEIYKIYDTGRHPCYTCNKQLPNLMNLMEHLHSSEHKQCTDDSETSWIEELRKKPVIEDNPNIPLQPVSGIEFMKPLSGFFCTLCKEHLLDFADGENHLKSNEHFLKYKNYLKEYPLYENKCVVKRLVKYSESDKVKKRVLEDKRVQLAKRKKESAEADERVKEIIKIQKSKEKQLEELEELNSIDATYDNQKLSSIKLNLNTDKEKRVSEKKTSSKDSKPKVVYIGKAPNYKNRPKPWYKRDMFSEKNKSSEFIGHSSDSRITLKEKISLSSKQAVASDESLSSVSSKSGNIKKPTEKISNTSKNEESCILAEQTNSKDSNRDKKNILIGPMNKDNIKITDPYVFDKDKNEIVCKSTDNIKSAISMKPNLSLPKTTKLGSGIDKAIKSSNDHVALSAKVSSKNELLKSEDPSINKAITNILNITDSAIHEELKLYSLSEIKLPENTTVSSNDLKKSVVQNMSVSEPISNMLPLKETHTIPPATTPTNFSFNQFKSIHTTPGKYTEEERDFMILGINKEDMKPIAVPVPPPMSILNFFSTVPPPNLISPPPNLMSHEYLPNTNYLNCVNPYRFESYPPIHSNVSQSLQFHQPVSMPERFQQPIPSIEVNQNNVSFPTTKPPTFKKQAQKSNKSNLITISPSKNVFTVNQSNVNHDKVNVGSILSENKSSITKINERTSGAIMKEELSNKIITKCSENIIIDSKIDEISISGTKELKSCISKSSDGNQNIEISKESERSCEEKINHISEDKVNSKYIDSKIQKEQISIGDTVCDASIVQNEHVCQTNLTTECVDEIVKKKSEELQKEIEVNAHITNEDSTKITMLHKSEILIEKQLCTPEHERPISAQNDRNSERVGQESEAERVQKEMEIDMCSTSEECSTKFTAVGKKFESSNEKELTKTKEDTEVSSHNDIELESVDQERQAEELHKKVDIDLHITSETSTKFTENKFETEKELIKAEQKKQVSFPSQSDMEFESNDQGNQAEEQKEKEISAHVISKDTAVKMKLEISVTKELPKHKQDNEVSSQNIKFENIDQESQAGELHKEVDIDLYFASENSSVKSTDVEKKFENAIEEKVSKPEQDKEIFLSLQNDLASKNIEQESKDGKLQKDNYITSEISSIEFTNNKHETETEIIKAKQVSLQSQNGMDLEIVQERQAGELQKEIKVDGFVTSEDFFKKFTAVEKKFESSIEKELPKEDKEISSQNDMEYESVVQERQAEELQKEIDIDLHVISETSSTKLVENNFETKKELIKAEQEKQVSLSSKNDMKFEGIDQESQVGEQQKEIEFGLYITSETTTKFTEKKFDNEKDLPKPEEKKQVSLSLQNDMELECADQESQAEALQREIEIDVHVTSKDFSIKSVAVEKMRESQVKSNLPNSEEKFTCGNTGFECNVIKMEENFLPTIQAPSVMQECISLPETKMQNSGTKDVKFEHIEDFEMRAKNFTESKISQCSNSSEHIVDENEKLQTEKIMKSEMIVTAPQTICSINERLINEGINIPCSHQKTNVDVVLNVEDCKLLYTKNDITSEQTESVILADSTEYSVENPSIEKDALSIDNCVISSTLEENQTDIENSDDFSRKDNSSVSLLSLRDLNNIKEISIDGNKEFKFMPKLLSENPPNNSLLLEDSLINLNTVQSSPPTLKSEIYEDSANIVKKDKKKYGFKEEETLCIELSDSKQFRQTCWETLSKESIQRDLLIDQNKSKVESNESLAKVTPVEIESTNNFFSNILKTETAAADDRKVNISSKKQKIESISAEEVYETHSDTSIKPEAQDVHIINKHSCNENRQIESNSEIFKKQNLGDSDQSFEHLSCTSESNSNVTSIENKYVIPTEYKQDADVNISHSYKKNENLVENICSISDKCDTGHLKNDSDTDEYEGEI